MFDDFDWGDWDNQATDYYDNFYTPMTDNGQYAFDDAIGNSVGNELGYSGDQTNYDSSFGDWNRDPLTGVLQYVGGNSGNMLGAGFGALAPNSGSGIASALRNALLKSNGQGTGNLGLIRDLLSTAAGMNALWNSGPKVGPKSVQPTHNATTWSVGRMPQHVAMSKGGSVLDKIRELYETYGPSMKPATTEYHRIPEDRSDVRQLLDDRGMMQDAARLISGRQNQLDELERQAVGNYAVGGSVPDYSDWGNLQQPVDINTLGINSPWGNLPNGPADPRLNTGSFTPPQQPSFQPQVQVAQPQQPPMNSHAMRMKDHMARRDARMQERAARHPVQQPQPMMPQTSGAPGFTSPSLVGYASGGQADVVNAKLAGGEYVMDADTVSALGDGNTDAGAQALDNMRENIRKHKRSAPVNKIPPKAKSPLAYMKGKV